jgi:predicted nucleotidyltransferase
MREPVISKEEVIERLRGAREELAALGVRRIGLFGSLVNGKPGPGSDVDMLIEFVPEQHTFDFFMELSFFLEELMARRVDLVTPESLSPHIGPHILREVERVQIAA